MPRPTRRRFAGASFAALAAAASAPVSAAVEYTLRLSTTTGPATASNVACSEWAAAVARRSKGRIKIEIYPNAQLVKEREAMSALGSGVVDFVTQASIFLEPLFPRVQALSLPFIFKDSATAYRTVDGPIGGDLFTEFETKGIVGLAWVASGFRELETVNRAVRTPDDMKGLRLRVQGGGVTLAMASALGAIPVAIDFSEVYTALQQHTIDAIETTPAGLIDSKLYTVLGNLAMTNHIFNFTPLLASKSKLESLPADLQKVVKDEAKAIQGPWRTRVERQNAETLALCKTNGMKFTDIDYPAFRKAMDPVYASLQSKIGGDFIQRLSRATGAG